MTQLGTKSNTGIAGGCHCGAIRYEASGVPEHHALCHCTDCRGWSGAPLVGWIAFREDQVTVTGEPATYRSSEHGERQFCPLCGTGLFYRNAVALPGIVDIQSGTLDDPAAQAPGAQIMVKERLPWTGDIAALPAFATYPGMD
ncbi:GFA family protein [Sphingomonas sp. DT-51]|uniref:GFA family protein n=1 Tax=Sphingomonas sp. DT-51 TaxID=3396165 RepID=UPI003F1DB4BA